MIVLIVDRRHVPVVPELAEVAFLQRHDTEVEVGFGADEVVDRDRHDVARLCLRRRLHTNCGERGEGCCQDAYCELGFHCCSSFQFTRSMSGSLHAFSKNALVGA